MGPMAEQTDAAGGIDDPLGPVLAGVGPRLRALRQQRGATLAQLGTATGISISTLSRLESGGGRRPPLDLLLPLAVRTRSLSTSWWAGQRRATPASTPGRSPATA